MSATDPATSPTPPLMRLDAMTCSPGVIGWWGLRHKDGWWVGTSKGANTYDDIYLARVALTILWQCDGGKSLNYKIERFTGANIIAGDFTPQKSAEDAIKDYEENVRAMAAGAVGVRLKNQLDRVTGLPCATCYSSSCSYARDISIGLNTHRNC